MDTLTSLPSGSLTLGVIVTSSLLLLVIHWRWSLVILFLQYVLTGLLFRDTQLPQVGGTHLLSGVIACSILYLTARQVRTTRGGHRRSISDMVLRLLTIALAAIALYGLSPDVLMARSPATILQAGGWLLVLGLLITGIAREPIHTAVGLLTFQTGFSLLYATLDSSLIVTGLLGVVNIALALVTAYLELARGGVTP